ncbi:hypothetical protein [Thorsellia anophelis]|uniref:Uncharacterized protein n=1 Tax=Thorsellia anophelis DSM 18579 TaxID=1123402 RepID=A0A1I0FV98_9GAMM|nr:hypothetical protein [Thorsellia anophelis]SET62446.1 hypothetical protein SAMN02583745_02909 [Thorsellia anophelis DSM 18579]
MIDYTIFHKQEISYHQLECDLINFDKFISAYNQSERVKNIFNKFPAKSKFWVIHPEYKFEEDEYPSGGEYIVLKMEDIVLQVDLIMDKLDIKNHIKNDLTLCIDCTGFMRNILILLLMKLSYAGMKKFRLLYSEPNEYIKQDNTKFSISTKRNPVIVGPYSNTTKLNPNSSLIINVGFDHKLISHVYQYKESSTVYPVFSFPSLSADMYQQSTLRASKSGEITSSTQWTTNRYYAPANDPFATACIVSEIVNHIVGLDPESIIYLSPLSTKIQVIGFVLFWLYENQKYSVNFLMPECTEYSRETSKGTKKIWYFEFETP